MKDLHFKDWITSILFVLFVVVVFISFMNERGEYDTIVKKEKEEAVQKREYQSADEVLSGAIAY